QPALSSTGVRRQACRRLSRGSMSSVLSVGPVVVSARSVVSVRSVGSLSTIMVTCLGGTPPRPLDAGRALRAGSIHRGPRVAGRTPEHDHGSPVPARLDVEKLELERPVHLRGAPGQDAGQGAQAE